MQVVAVTKAQIVLKLSIDTSSGLVTTLIVV